MTHTEYVVRYTYQGDLMETHPMPDRNRAILLAADLIKERFNGVHVKPVRIHESNRKDQEQ